MLTVRIGSLTFEVETHARTTSVRITQRGRAGEVTGAAQTTETKAALKAILAFIS